jgi:hypothetical protein
MSNPESLVKKKKVRKIFPMGVGMNKRFEIVLNETFGRRIWFAWSDNGYVLLTDSVTGQGEL